MINPAAASCFYNSEIYFFQRVKCFIFKPVENTPNLFLVSISLKARCTRLSFKVSACVCVRSCVCVCVCVSEILTMPPGLAHSLCFSTITTERKPIKADCTGQEALCEIDDSLI